MLLCEARDERIRALCVRSRDGVGTFVLTIHISVKDGQHVAHGARGDTPRHHATLDTGKLLARGGKSLTVGAVRVESSSGGARGCELAIIGDRL